MMWKRPTGNDRSPTVDRRLRRTISEGSEEERRRLRASRSVAHVEFIDEVQRSCSPQTVLYTYRKFGISIMSCVSDGCL